jgi:hypothetical protein
VFGGSIPALRIPETGDGGIGGGDLDPDRGIVGL